MCIFVYILVVNIFVNELPEQIQTIWTNTSYKGPVGAVIQGSDTKGWAVKRQKQIPCVDF